MSSVSGTSNGHGKEAALYEEQLSKIGKVRTDLGQLSGKSALYCSDASIARYLMARNWDVKKATRMLKKTLKWRSEYKPDEIRWDDISDEAVTGKTYRTDYFDKIGRSILVMRPGCQNTKNPNGQVKYLVYCMENAILNLPHGQDQMVWLIDFAGFNLGNLSIQVTKMTADVLQGHYPERLGVAILYNAPKFFEPFWKMASPLLEKKTRNKVKFVYSDRPDTMKIMEDLFNMEELECAFGGKNPATFNINDYAPENSALASEPYQMSSQKALGSISGAKTEDAGSGKRENMETAPEKSEESDIESEKEEQTRTESSTVEQKSLPGEANAPADKSGV
ncbi:unnamed protein product [Miscanthus lutarioriparius]|uniref:CRAL-TRIO domain-containing protein n=1 Tax=Miscanthus lutarioriparius TaxID=422564 RepID=A0A811PSL0_9POAL|nr:unnamed protein product [Miscanthus lutarioriparius]